MKLLYDTQICFNFKSPLSASSKIWVTINGQNAPELNSPAIISCVTSLHILLVSAR